MVDLKKSLKITKKYLIDARKQLRGERKLNSE